MTYLLYAIYTVLLFLSVACGITLIEEYEANKTINFKSWKRRFYNLLQSKFL